MKKIIILLTCFLALATFGQTGTTLSAPENMEADSILIFTPQKKAAHIPYTNFEAKLKASFDNLYIQTETDPIFNAWDKDYSDLINKPVFKVVENEYAVLDSLYANQANQTATFIQYVLDATGFPTVTSGAKYFEYLGTTNGNDTDYRLLSDSESEPISNGISNVPYNSITWDNNLEGASKNAIRDKIIDIEQNHINLLNTNQTKVGGSINLSVVDTLANSLKLNWSGLLKRNYAGNTSFSLQDTGAGQGAFSIGTNTLSMTMRESGPRYIRFNYNIDVTGNATATAFIKTGATSDDVLLGDGSTTSLAGIGGGGGGAVSSVNGQTGAVVLDADDIDDTSTAHKFVTAAEKGLIGTALQDAPSDGNEYVRKDGDWEVATGGGATNAENVIVSPAIGGNTDAYAVMEANRTSIDSIQANMSSGINTEFQPETYAATFNYAFDSENPNKYIDLSGNIDIEIFGTVNGDAGNLYLNRGTGSETIIFSNGLPPTNLSYPTKPTDVVQLYFVHSDSGIQWYLQNPTQQPKLIQTLLGDGTTTLDFTKGSIVKFLFGSTNEVFDIIPPADNTEVVITFKQDATGSRTATLPINFGGVGSTSPAALSTTANALDYRKFDYIDGYFYPTASVNDVQFDTPEPEPITGTIISDTSGFVAGNPPANSFDDETTTQYHAFASGGAWAGYDYGVPVIINRFRILPMQHASTHTTINNARIEYSSNGTTGWTSVYTVTGIDGSNYTNWIDVTFTPVSARYWRVITPTTASYFRIAEIKFFEAE